MLNGDDCDYRERESTNLEPYVLPKLQHITFLYLLSYAANPNPIDECELAKH